jgi:uncharacterized protein with PIN domain
MKNTREVKFDPTNPRCPKCNRVLKEQTRVETKRYEEPAGNLHIHVCHCGAATGYFVLDVPDDSGYVLGEIS